MHVIDDWCPECEQAAPGRVERRNVTYEVRGSIPIALEDVLVRVCCRCGQDRGDPALDDATLVRACTEAGLHECVRCGRWLYAGEPCICPARTKGDREMAAYLVREETFPALVSVEDALVADYLAAGYREATAEEIAAWQHDDVYGGTQGPPVAPPVESAPPGEAQSEAESQGGSTGESAGASTEDEGAGRGAKSKGSTSAAGKSTDSSTVER